MTSEEWGGRSAASVRPVDDDSLLEVLYQATGAVARALDGLDDWGPSGNRPGQYKLDLAADEAAVTVLRTAGLAVLSEESGVTGDPGPTLAVLDPVDGSTNAHRGIPYYAVSMCVLDREGPRVSVVVNPATDDRYDAVRGGGARHNGAAVSPSGSTALSSSLVGISGCPPRHLGWAQYRAFGAASLECCAVAEGVLDAYLQAGEARLFGWDYLGGLLLCQEAGAVAADLAGQDLVVRDDSVRRPVMAATPALLAEVTAALVR